MKSLKKAFCLGACAYPTMELLYRGRTHWSMALAGGLGAVALKSVCCRARLTQCLTGAALITGIEYAIGKTCNRNHQVWDYSRQPLHVDGQICLCYSVLWALISLAAIPLVDRL